MTILNVVQPDEFDPNEFEVVAGKLTPKISSHPDNILEISSDGLYAASGTGGSVLGRYRYDTSVNGEVIHKGIKFDFELIDGAVDGYIYGVNPDDITPDDTIYYNGEIRNSWFDDVKQILEIKWGSERVHRSIITLFRNGGVPEIWSVQITPTVDNWSGGDNLIVIIDEMIDVGVPTNDSIPGDGDNGGSEPGSSLDKPWFHLGLFSPQNANGELTSVIGLPDGDVVMVGHTDGQPDADKLISICALPPMSPDALPATATYGYCPVTGHQLHFDGTNFIYRPNPIDSYQLGDLPVPGASSFSGVSFGNSTGDGVTAYTINETAVHYYLFTGSDPLTIPGQTIELPPGLTVLRYAVSGHIAYYLIVENGNYALYAINLETQEAATTVLLPQASEDPIPALLNTGLGGVIVYLDKIQMQVLSVVAPRMDMDSFTLSTTLLDPQLLTSPLMFTDFLNHIGFGLSGTSLFKHFLEPATMSFARLSLDFLTGEFSIASTPLPDSFMSGLISAGQPAAILGFSANNVAYDYSNDGSILTYAELAYSGAAKMYQASALLRFPAIGKVGLLAIDPSDNLSFFGSSFAGVVDTSFNYIDQEQPYAQTRPGRFVWDQNAHAAAWVARNNHVYLARFDTTTLDPVITDLGETTNENPWLEMSHDSSGDVYVSEKATNNGADIKVWKVDVNNGPAISYHKESIVDETAWFEGEHICGNKLVVFEGSSVEGVSGIRLRSVNIDTDVSVISDQIPHIIFANCKFANLTGNTFVVINKLFTEGTWDNIGTRIMLVTVNDTEIIIEDTGALSLINNRDLVNGDNGVSSATANDGSRVVNLYVNDSGTNYILRVSNAGDVMNLSRYQITDEYAQAGATLTQGGLPLITLTSGDTAFIQHDFSLSSLKSINMQFVPYSTIN